MNNQIPEIMENSKNKNAQPFDYENIDYSDIPELSDSDFSNFENPEKALKTILTAENYLFLKQFNFPVELTINEIIENYRKLIAMLTNMTNKAA